MYEISITLSCIINEVSLIFGMIQQARITIEVVQLVKYRKAARRRVPTIGQHTDQATHTAHPVFG